MIVTSKDGKHHVYVSNHGGYRTDHAVNVPEVREADCGGPDRPTVIRDQIDGRRRITICTDRIERAASRAAAAQVDARKMQRLAMVKARAGIRMARGAILANRALTEEQRDQALEGLDREIERMDAERDSDQ